MIERSRKTLSFSNGLILALLLVAFALRLYKLSSVPLNIDEITTISRYVPLPLLDIFTTYDSNNHPLASALAHFFSPQANHLFILRWPFILIGMLSLPFVYRLGNGLFGPKVGLLALLLMTASTVHAGYSMIIRGYIGLITMTTISLYCLWRAWRYNRWRDWLGLLVVNILVVYFHLFGGIVAAGTQLGLLGLGLLWQMSRQTSDSAGLKSRLLKWSLVVMLLGLIHLLPLYFRASAIIMNERWLDSEFRFWQDGAFSLEDFFPLTVFMGLMAPFGAGGIGYYIYLIFAVIGLAALWFRQRILALGLLVWFVIPFGAIFAALQLLGLAFYAYVRFLLYFLSPFLLLVALGMITTTERISVLAHRHKGLWLTGNRVFNWLALASLLILLVISVRGYALVSTHIDWLALANTLSAHLQPQDITICEEHQRGFAAPDRARAYCLWMLDYLVPALRGATYTPRFQNSMDFVANYDHLQEQRLAMQQPGGVWLILWQKTLFRTDQLIMPEDNSSFPSLATFEPYQAWQFGSAILVHIATERTLLENVYQAVKLLLKVESQPADQARYYRSLAEWEAVQGHRQQAHNFFDQSWHMVELAGQQYPSIFLAETQPLIERIPAAQPPPLSAFKMSTRFGSVLCLQSYTISPANLKAGQSLKLNLYWQTIDFVPENYTFFIRLKSTSDPFQADLRFQPFDGTYPTPWWWAGQQLTEQREFSLPPDLARQDYKVSLGVYDPQAAGEEEVEPLFLMRYQLDVAGSAYWHAEALSPHMNEACLQFQ